LQQKKVVYAASSSCYGIPEKFPTNESSVCDPKYPYALTKYLGEQIIRHWNSVYGLPTISLRLFNVYGPRARTSGTYGAVFGVFLKQKLSNSPLTVVGDGSQKRDFLYVTDVVCAFLAAAETEKVGCIYNLGAGKPQTIIYLVDLLGGKKIYISKRTGEPDCTWADITRISEDLKWAPQVSFEEGVTAMVANIDYWKSAPLWDVEKITKATKTWFKYMTS
jgi:UDP-glucose 4-epimerase